MHQPRQLARPTKMITGGNRCHASLTLCARHVPDELGITPSRHLARVQPVLALMPIACATSAYAVYSYSYSKPPLDTR